MMRIALFRFGFVLAGSFILPIIPLDAEEMRLQPRFTLGTSYYSLTINDFEIGGGVVDQTQFNDLLYITGAGFTFSNGRYFVDISGQYSFGGDTEVNDNAVDGGNIVNLDQDVDFDRIESNVTFGYQINEQFTTYLGFRFASLEFDGEGQIGDNAAGVQTDITQYGPVAGGAYTFPQPIFGGALIANGALAFVKGDITLDVEGAEDDLNGNTAGINAGISWVRPLDNNFTVSLGADTSAYFAAAGGEDTEEYINRIRADLRYNFSFE